MATETEFWIRRISVTDVGRCPIQFQYREFGQAREGPQGYAAIRGKVVHLLFEDLSNPQVQAIQDYSKFYNRYIDAMIADRLQANKIKKDLPRFEAQIRNFYNSSLGKELTLNLRKIEEVLEGNIDGLSLNLPTTHVTTQSRYTLVGKPDFIGLRPGKEKIIEVKSRPDPRTSDYRQALFYQVLWNANNPGKPIGYRLLNITPKLYKLRVPEQGAWLLKRIRMERILREMRTQLEQTIKWRERLLRHPNDPFLDFKPVKKECRNCGYERVCPRSACKKHRSALYRFLNKFSGLLNRIMERIP
jgi:CRISPR/Cas system-associated exonuclease Cas4 (RecB family)